MKQIPDVSCSDIFLDHFVFGYKAILIYLKDLLEDSFIYLKVKVCRERKNLNSQMVAIARVRPNQSQELLGLPCGGQKPNT